MAWKVGAWCLLVCVVSTRAQPQDIDRDKRFMVSDIMSMDRKESEYFKLPIPNLDQYNDWDPVNEYPFPVTRRSYSSSQHNSHTKEPAKLSSASTKMTKNSIERSDKLLLEGEAIAREHAKLVHDINSLIEASPGGWSRLMEQESTPEPKDESIYTENFNSGLRLPVVTPVTRPPVVNLKILPGAVTPVAIVKPPVSMPLILLGGEAIKQSMKNLKTSMLRHPYTFVGAASTNRPSKLRPLIPLAYPMRTTSQSLWERFVSIFPRLVR